ncbi:uncharacterized protein [Magallana gigas]|uniref:uncharacterized protein isoform X6 n=1 Tax=Magallana gigas TaxID=29159 RepID=UPI00333FB1A8
MPIRNISVFLTLVFFVTLAFAQNRETVTGCIAGNVTMKFKPALLDGKKVKTYVWNKVRGVNKDPSFAKFEPGASPDFEIYFNKEHQVQNRLIHHHDEPATLYLTNLRKSDQQQYTLVISYVDYVGTPTEWIIDLQVQDVCFEKPKEVGKCAVTTCYTGDNGVLKTPDGANQTVMGYKLVKACDDKTSGNYSCCNAAGTCLVQALQESTDVSTVSTVVSSGDNMPSDGPSGNTYAIVGGVVGVLAVLGGIAAVVAVVLIKKRREGHQVPSGENQDEQKVPL